MDNIFSQPNIRECEEYVISLQRQLDKAVVEGNRKDIHRLFDLLTKRSDAVKILAINRITRLNSGKYTAGVDGINTPKDKGDANLFRHNLLNEIDLHKRPDKIKRAFIPKSHGKLRPLGIPTISDRINQDIIRTGLEPIVEYHFHPNSYGFRPKRSCQDAMVHLHKKLANANRPKYVVEGDIKGCFDNIKHTHILETLENWQTPNWAIEIIAKMLRADIIHENKVYANKAGTPQGGVISPMLANVALTTLDYHCQQFAEHTTNPIVRYADDFVIVCVSEKKGKEIKENITEHLAEKAGLTLSDEKTAITHISKGFNFLGFNFRKYKPRNNPNGRRILLIKPQPERVRDFLRAIKQEVRKHYNMEQSELIHHLNPKIIGFGMYYRHCVAQETFNKIDHIIWQRLLRWGKRKTQEPTNRVIRRYFYRPATHKKSLTFGDRDKGIRIYELKRIPIRRFNKVRTDYRIFDSNPEIITYWQKRDYTNSLKSIIPITRRKLYQQQNGRCNHCNRPFVESDILDSKIHLDHVVPKSVGGSNKLDNLRLVHQECHLEIHESK